MYCLKYNAWCSLNQPSNTTIPVNETEVGSDRRRSLQRAVKLGKLGVAKVLGDQSEGGGGGVEGDSFVENTVNSAQLFDLGGDPYELRSV